MTVRENMAFGLKLRRLPKAEIEQRVKRAAGILDLSELLDRYPRQLSGGQRQRVAMGRAIVRDPQVFLFDEPLSNLDAKLRVQMRAEIKELHQKLKTTAIYVTHDQVEAMTMADRIVVLREGWIEQVGDPLDLYDRPANLFVAGFIGSPAMNFIRSKVKRSNGTGRLVTDDGVPLPGEAPPGMADGDDVIYGVRPEHLFIGEGAGVPARVSVVEPTGAETLVIGRVGQQTVQVQFKERRHFAPGDEIQLQALPNTVHLFTSDGKRIG
jgi:multiple sugar transport system ATP-binding protein